MLQSLEEKLFRKLLWLESHEKIITWTLIERLPDTTAMIPQ